MLHFTPMMSSTGYWLTWTGSIITVCVEIQDYVFIRGNSRIVGGVSIGPNAVIGAGSVITRDVPEGTVVAGNPARVVGKFEDLHRRRKEKYGDSRINVLDLEPDFFWKEFYEALESRKNP